MPKSKVLSVHLGKQARLARQRRHALAIAQGQELPDEHCHARESFQVQVTKLQAEITEELEAIRGASLKKALLCDLDNLAAYQTLSYILHAAQEISKNLRDHHGVS